MNGVIQIFVDVEKSVVEINTIDESVVDKVREKLSSLGYPPAGEDNTILHKAKSMVSCATGKFGS